jgi:hypothetical protein
MFCERGVAQEHHVNTDRIGASSSPWNKDDGVAISMVFIVTEIALSRGYLGQGFQLGDLVHVRYELNHPGKGYAVTRTLRNDQQVTGSSMVVKKTPQVLRLSPDANVRDEIDLDQMNDSERQLIWLGFGRAFKPEALRAQSVVTRIRTIARAEERLNKRLKEFFPAALPFSFRLLDIGGEGKRLAVSLVDGVDGHTGIGVRGSGIRS